MALLKTQSERRLFVLLISVVGALVVVVGGSAAISYRAFLTADLAQVESEQMEAESWLSQGSFWKERLEWLDKNQPLLTEQRQDGLSFLEMIESSAATSGIQITAKSLQESKLDSTGQWTGLPIQVEATGPFSAVLTWLHQLENTTNFILVNSLSMKAGAKPQLVSCRLELVRCFKIDPKAISR